MQTTQADINRLTAKIETYRQAVERVGFDAVVEGVGTSAAGAFVMVDEAAQRQYPDYDLIGMVLAQAQEYGDKHCGINDADHSIYDVLKSL